MQGMTQAAPPINGQAGPQVADECGIGDIMQPAGYRILVRIVSPDGSLKRLLDSKIAMPDEARDREWAAQVWAIVIRLGPQAYVDSDRQRFGGPWCKPGDCIIMRPYSGTRFKVRDQLYALINDDTVQAVVTDVSELERA